ncbi:MAG: helix-hairpin-helix domain-containing protein [Oscillospiraceae bacterium]|nr:helix-hairpin-helix domain-containing protein [Oscillospiraceae bacterium]
MRLRRLEFVVIALTLAFICFMGGYFTGRRGAVNIVTVEPRQNETQNTAIAAEIPTTVASESAEGSGNPNAPNANTGASGSLETPAAVTGGDATAQPPETEDIVGAPKGGDGKININLASQSELMDLPGVGSVLASRIVDYRRQYGGFRRIEDLRSVSGIGEKRYEAIKDMITVG